MTTIVKASMKIATIILLSLIGVYSFADSTQIDVAKGDYVLVLIGKSNDANQDKNLNAKAPAQEFKVPDGDFKDHLIVELDKFMDLEGTVEAQNNSYILLKTDDGSEIAFSKSNIIKLTKGKPYSRFYPTFGVTYGNPSILNFFVQYTFDKVSARVSGMYLNAIKGIQLDVGYVSYQNRLGEASLDVVGGYKYDTSSTAYLGLSIHVIASIFYAELDAVYDFPQIKPEITGQIGLAFMIKQ